MSDKLIVAVGNPGTQYAKTRHNIAWMALEHLSFSGSLSWKDKFKGEYAQISVGNDKIYFLMPQTFMNLSGESVQPFAAFFKIKPEDILVIHDELDLPFNSIVFKKGGGHAGHNGLKSISAQMGTLEFLRLRLGIGRPVHGSVSDWVLGKFHGEDEQFLEGYLKEAAEAIECFINSGFDKAASKYSKKKGK